ncbi:MULTISPECIES: DUF4166 domain-containing protein [unclassified Brevibacterium]|uniref:DUF4166 domain-containing protein n=1 Tax=unclassified Brevibacterium TaxID=2614124 RepID=UPI0010930623|nr:DUF4166 domain-containing protein [Brevibacterium sp. S22]TGD30978.1 DUF4166 domain-containing protein [Brevibacterium sp. S22]
MSREIRSPYERALGSRLDELHPVLRRYFAAIPAGWVGIGEGVFDRFGTEQRWLLPILALARRCRVIVPGMHREVPFRVENRTEDGKQTATRTLFFDKGAWSMVDAVSFVPGRRPAGSGGNRARRSRGGNSACGSRGGVIDVLGSPSIVDAEFDVDVVDEGLRLRSRRVALRLGRLRVPVPKAICPVVALNETFDDSSDRQRVALVVDTPIIGRVYEYTGTFTYRIEERSGRCAEPRFG